MSATLDDYLRVLPGLRRSGEGFTGPCPCCEFEDFRLTVYSAASARIVGKEFETYCPNGCKPREIQRALSELTIAAHKTSPNHSQSLCQPSSPLENNRLTQTPVANRTQDLIPSLRVEEILAKMLTFEQLCNLPAPNWQIEGLFFEKSIVEIFGPTNKGKTLVALDLCCSLCEGGDWCGRPIIKPGPVLYVNADGGAGFSERAKAWREANRKEHLQHELITYPEPIMLHKIGDMLAFKMAVEKLEPTPACIVFDTYSQCIAGMNENLQECASLVVQQFNDIKNRFGCCVIFLHHTGKSGEQDRGSTVIPGAADTIIRVDQDEETGVVTMTCKKQRDGERFLPLSFTIDRVPGTSSVCLHQCEAPVAQSDLKEDRLQQIVNFCTEFPGQTQADICLRLNLDKRPTARDIGEILERGWLEERPAVWKPGQTGRRATAYYTPSESLV